MSKEKKKGKQSKRISAEEVRSMGVYLPDSIPDEATVRRSAMKMDCEEVSGPDKNGKMIVRMCVCFKETFE